MSRRVEERTLELDRQRLKITKELERIKKQGSQQKNESGDNKSAMTINGSNVTTTHVEKTMKVLKKEPTVKKALFRSMISQFSKNKNINKLKTNAPCFHDDSSSDDESNNTKSPSMIRAQINQSAINAQINSSQPAPVSFNAVNLSASTPSSSGRRRKNRWGEKVTLSAPPGFAQIPGMVKPQVAVLPVQTTNLGLPQNYRPVGLVGCTELSDAQRKQLEEQREMQAMYNMIMASRNTAAAASVSASNAQQPQPQQTNSKKKNKYAYDSDEDVDDVHGTWEHQQRRLEMGKTQALAEKLTGQGHGKHFIGDFLPPAELAKFMETFKALKEGRTPDYSDYKEFKLQCDNIGFKMLKKMGWKEGEGLGSEGKGITAPVNKGKRSLDGGGVGLAPSDALTKNDDDFSAYRKRMMLAYRFRPNPLNNPRRPYY